jgi:molybdate transport system ATP-binding protein
MQGLEQRRPHELSGGQRQRVAVARALAREPDLLLLDEPFSAVDQVVRRKLREELLDLTGALKCAVLMVTHDLAEAAMLGARIGVIQRGRLLQLGTREEVFYRPASPLVARLMEMRNLIPARVERCLDGEAGVAWAGRTFVAATSLALRVGDPVWMGVRPEHVLVVRQDGPARPNEVSGTVRRLLHLGSLVRVLVEPAGAPEELTLEFSEHLMPRFQVREGGPIRVSLWHERLHLMPRAATTDGSSAEMQDIPE